MNSKKIWLNFTRWVAALAVILVVPSAVISIIYLTILPLIVILTVVVAGYVPFVIASIFEE